MKIKLFYIFKVISHFSKTHVQNSLKRFGSHLLEACQKNNMIVAARNTQNPEPLRFAILNFSTIINNFSERLCYPVFVIN